VAALSEEIECEGVALNNIGKTFSGPGFGDDSFEQGGASGGVGFGRNKRISLAEAVKNLVDVGQIHRSVK
jgi:hypothetical protein